MRERKIPMRSEKFYKATRKYIIFPLFVLLPPSLLCFANIDYVESKWFLYFSYAYAIVLSLLGAIYFVNEGYKWYKRKDYSLIQFIIYMPFAVVLMSPPLFVGHFITMTYGFGALVTSVFGRYSEAKVYDAEVHRYRPGRRQACHTNLVMSDPNKEVPRIRLCRTDNRLITQKENIKIKLVTGATIFGTVISKWEIVE
jgi:hypothetical protein